MEVLRPVELRYVVKIGGTVLHTSRTNPYSPKRLREGAPERICRNLKERGIEALLVIGGDDTLKVAARLSRGEEVPEPIPCIGIPKTIDNDVWGTDWCIGFDSAVTTAVRAAEHLLDHAKSHRRIVVLEVMGRKAGWIALFTALGVGADWALVPEESPAPIEAICEEIKRIPGGTGLVVAAEGIEHPRLTDWRRALEGVMAKWEDEFGHRRPSYLVGEWVANYIQGETGREARAVALGPVQRGGAPTSFDRVLAVRFGAKAVELLREGRYGEMVAIRGGQITSVPLAGAAGKVRTLTGEWLELARDLGMFGRRA